MKKIFYLFAVLAVLGAVLLAGCGQADIEKVEDPAGDTTDQPETDATEDTNQEAPDETQAEDTQNLKVGDSVNFNGLQITLKGVRAGQGGEFDQPTKDKYIYAELVAENTSDETQAVSSIMNLTLMDAEGYAQDFGIATDAKGSFDGEIAPGRKIAGEVVFDVEESEYYELIYSDLITTGQVIWKINNEDIGQ